MPARTDIREPDLVDFDEGFAEPDRTLKFRGPSYDEAVQAAEDALGTRPRVLSAHRIQRGGIGGFFATDLGVEVEVEVPGEDVDETLDRLVEPAADETASAEEDRAAWIRELARAAGLDIGAFVEPPAAAADPAAAAPVATAPAAVAPATTAPAAAAPATTAALSVSTAPTAAAVAPAAVQRFGYGEYLSELDLAGSDEPTASPAPSVPSATPGPAPVVPEPAWTTAAAPSSRPAPARRRTASVMKAAAARPAATPAPAPRPARHIATPARPQATAPTADVDFDPRHEPDIDPDLESSGAQVADAAPSRRPSVPTRHHVDLAVVATSELVRLSGGFDPGTVVDIQVTVTSSDGRSVSAEATVERPARPGRRRPEARR